MDSRLGCPFYIGLPPRNEEKEAAQHKRPIRVGCLRVFDDGTPCGGSWEAHYGAGGASQRVAEPKPRSGRNARLAALEQRFKDSKE